MQIVKLSHQRLDLTLTEPYTIAYETVSESPNIILKIETVDGHTGWGCATPDLPVTGESPEDVIHALENVIEPYLKGKDVFEYTRLIYELKQQLPNASSAMNMVDMALRDAIARKTGVPLYKLMGGFRHSIETSITIGILPLKETLEKALEFTKSGFCILKIKGGVDVDKDIEKMLKLREVHGENIRLRFDGNQGYNSDQAIRFMKECKAARLELFEQPTPQEFESQLGIVTDKVSIPVMADESLKTLKDVFRLAQNKLIDMINIKLMKVGGITEGVHINSVAKSAGIESMVGCFDECGLGIAAGLHFALSRPNIEFADLDGHLELKDDPFTNLFVLKNGFLQPTDAPGLGNISGF